MKISTKIVFVDKEGDRPIEMSFNDSNMTDSVNMHIGEKHYRVNISELKKMVNVIKMIDDSKWGGI